MIPLIALLPKYTSLLAAVCHSLSAQHSVERSFSQMKLIKTRLCTRLGELSLSHLMNIAIESPETLSEGDLEEVITVWNRNGRRSSYYLEQKR